MTTRTIIAAPHPDDEVLGAGGTLLRRKAQGGQTAWLLMTCMDIEHGWTQDQIDKKASQIVAIAKHFEFDAVYELKLPTTHLDAIPMHHIVEKVATAIKAFAPTEVLVPHSSDIHTDHHVTFNAVGACTKWFRYPSIERVMAYETLSETEFGLDPSNTFRPNVYIDIGDQLDAKLAALQIYSAELGAFPFPRSAEAVKALAMVRGSAAGFHAAEAFELLRERS